MIYFYLARAYESLTVGGRRTSVGARRGASLRDNTLDGRGTGSDDDGSSSASNLYANATPAAVSSSKSTTAIESNIPILLGADG